MTTEEHFNDYVFDHSINIEREAYLTDRLVAFNRANTSALPLEPVAPLPIQISILDASGRVLGGLIGRTHAIPEWLEISIIWIEESARRSGLGRRLMAEAEQEARRRGCRYARVITSDFQAPGFYRRIGYRDYGTLENCPPGETVYYLWRQLDRRDTPLSGESSDTVDGGQA
jgi:ribosomal protein S18 acetylase RimI-like enzyme